MKHSIEEVRELTTKAGSLSNFLFLRDEKLCAHRRRTLNWGIHFISRRVCHCMSHTHSRPKALPFVRWQMTSSKLSSRSRYLSVFLLHTPMAAPSLENSIWLSINRLLPCTLLSSYAAPTQPFASLLTFRHIFFFLKSLLLPRYPW